MSRQWDIPQGNEEEIRRAAGDRREFSNPNPIPPEQSASNNPEVTPEALPPPPPPVDLVMVLDDQNCILEFLANAMVNQNNAGQGNVQYGPNHYIHRIMDFHQLRLLKFKGSDNPIEANDWLCEIEMKLDAVHANDRDRALLTIQQLVGPALAWWHRYKEVNPDTCNMVWNDFVRLFHEHHCNTYFLQE
jgi:hypothetical protein